MGVSCKWVDEWQASFRREFGEMFGEFAIIIDFPAPWELESEGSGPTLLAFNMFFFEKPMYFYAPCVQFIKYRIN
jgi:hypothetical protein